MNYIIYKTTNQVNEKYYVGQHFTSDDDGYLGSGKYFKRAVKKYSKENFVRETIEFCTSANVNEKEVYWINVLSATNKSIGYNISKGGNSPMKGMKHTEEAKRKISQNQPNQEGENNPCFGKKWKHTEEAKRKISQSRIGKKHHMFGKHFSEKIRNNKCKYIYIINGMKVKNLSIFCENNNLNFRGLRSAVNKKIPYWGKWFIKRRLK